MLLQAGNIIAGPYECFPDKTVALGSKAAISWKQSIHCFLKEHHELWKSNQTLKNVCIFHCSKLECALPPEKWIAGLASQNKETCVLLFGKADETGINNSKAAMHDNITCFFVLIVLELPIKAMQSNV